MRVTAICLLLLYGITSRGYAAELPDFTSLFEVCKPSIVNISTSRQVDRSRTPRDFHMPPGGPQGPEGQEWEDLLRRFFQTPEQDEWSSPEKYSLGSGFVLSADGYIITNHHVIHGADEIVVRLYDRRELKATVIGSDELSDTALLKINASGLQPLPIGDANRMKVGEWVVAIGSPFGFDYSITAGIVSAKGRSLSNQNYVPFIQTDVAVNPGNSGGPLINMEGKVVGVNSQIFSNTGGFMGLSFSIPIELVLDVVEQLKTKGQVSRGWLGVVIQEVTRELAESFDMEKPQGALVSKVLPDSPAQAAGIKAGDIIVQFNDQPIESSGALPPLVGRVKAGQTATVKVLREGRLQVLKLKIGELNADQLATAGGDSAPQQPGKQNTRLGLVLQETDARIRKEYNLDGGVLVADVQAGPAAAAGLRPGDVIASLNNRPVQGVQDFTERLDKLKSGSSVAVLVQRGSGPIYLALRIP
jgi:serine protease Do